MKAIVYSGLAIKQLLSDRGISVRHIAEKLQVSEQSVYEILRKNEVKRSTALKFYEALGMEMPDKETLIQVPLPDAHLSKTLEEQKNEIDYLRKLVAQLAQSNAALIEKLGKFSASELLAEAYA